MITIATDVYNKLTILRFVANFGALLSKALLDPEASISRLEYLSVEKKQQLLEGFNDPAALYRRAVQP